MFSNGWERNPSGEQTVAIPITIHNKVPALQFLHELCPSPSPADPTLHPGEEVHDDVEGVIERGEEREEREVAAEDLVGRLAPEPLELGVDELQTGEEDGGDELLLALRVRSGGRPPSSARRRWGLRGRHAGATRARGGRTGRRPRR